MYDIFIAQLLYEYTLLRIITIITPTLAKLAIGAQNILKRYTHDGSSTYLRRRWRHSRKLPILEREGKREPRDFVRFALVLFVRTRRLRPIGRCSDGHVGIGAVRI